MITHHAYHYITDNGPKTITEIVEWFNNEREGRRYSVTSQQMSNLFRVSPLFQIVGEVEILYPHWTRLPVGKGGVSAWDVHAGSKTSDRRKGGRLTAGTMNSNGAMVNLYDVVPVEQVVDSMLDNNGELRQHRVKKTYPRVIQYELKARGVEI